jgi:hypothetical protein
MEACMHTVPLENFYACLHMKANEHWNARVSAEADAQARFSCKPMDMKVRNYYQAVGRINDEELPQLPPFGADQSLSTNKVLDILLHGTPKSWQVEMDCQGFDPLDKTIPEVIDFIENMRLPMSILISLKLLRRSRVLPPTTARRTTTSPMANESQPISAKNMSPTSVTTLKNAALLPTRKATLPRRRRGVSPTRLGFARPTWPTAPLRRSWLPLFKRKSRKESRSSLLLSPRNARTIPTQRMNRKTRSVSSSRNSPKESMDSTTMIWRNSPFMMPRTMTKSAFEW